MAVPATCRYYPRTTNDMGEQVIWDERWGWQPIAEQEEAEARADADATGGKEVGAPVAFQNCTCNRTVCVRLEREGERAGERKRVRVRL